MADVMQLSPVYVTQKWQPIETAPKAGGQDGDGPNILLWEACCNPEDYQSSVYIGFWTNAGAYATAEKGFWADWGRGTYDLVDGTEEWHALNPTHWMPLPSAPNA